MKQPPLTWESSGSWTYRSFRNNATYPYLTAPPTAHGLILQEALFKLETPTDTTLQGTIEWQGGGLDLRGTDRGSGFDIVGTGRPGTDTNGWEYRYDGYLISPLPHANDERPTLVGSVIRAKPHGDRKAGEVFPLSR